MDVSRTAPRRKPINDFKEPDGATYYHVVNANLICTILRLVPVDPYSEILPRPPDESETFSALIKMPLSGSPSNIRLVSKVSYSPYLHIKIKHSVNLYAPFAGKISTFAARMP